MIKLTLLELFYDKNVPHVLKKAQRAVSGGCAPALSTQWMDI